MTVKMASDDFSDLSSLSSLSPPPPSDSESEPEVKKKGILKFFTKVSKDKMAAEKEPSPPPPRKREPSPPHEPQFADNQDIAVSSPFFPPDRVDLVRSTRGVASDVIIHCANLPLSSL